MGLTCRRQPFSRHPWPGVDAAFSARAFLLRNAKSAEEMSTHIYDVQHDHFPLPQHKPQMHPYPRSFLSPFFGCPTYLARPNRTHPTSAPILSVHPLSTFSPSNSYTLQKDLSATGCAPYRCLKVRNSKQLGGPQSTSHMSASVPVPDQFRRFNHEQTW